MQCSRRSLLLAAAVAPVLVGCAEVRVLAPDAGLHRRLARAYTRVGRDSMASMIKDVDSTRVERLPSAFLGADWLVLKWVHTATSNPVWDIVALGPKDELVVLLGRPEGLTEALAGSGASVATPEQATAVAETASQTARPSIAAHQRIDSVADIEYPNVNPRPADLQADIDRIAARYGERVRPLAVRRVDTGYSAEYWTVTQKQLIHHRLDITERSVSHHPEVVERDLPTPIAIG